MDILITITKELKHILSNHPIWEWQKSSHLGMAKILRLFFLTLKKNMFFPADTLCGGENNRHSLTRFTLVGGHNFLKRFDYDMHRKQFYGAHP